MPSRLSRVGTWIEGALRVHNLMPYVVLACYAYTCARCDAGPIGAAGAVLFGVFGIRTWHGVRTAGLKTPAGSPDPAPDAGAEPEPKPED